jgi:hypothetical protein
MDGGEMKIKPISISWEFDKFNGDFCCKQFKLNSTMSYTSCSMPIIYTDGETVFFKHKKISHCPYCGKKIELEKEVKQ